MKLFYVLSSSSTGQWKAVLLIYGLAMLPFSGSWLESLFFLQMNWRSEAEIDCDTVAVRTESTPRNIVIHSHLLTVINFTLKKFHSDEIPLFWSSKVILLNYFLLRYQVKTRNYSVSVSVSPYYERVYLFVGQVHANVKLCPEEIKTDVLWHLPRKLI